MIPRITRIPWRSWLLMSASKVCFAPTTGSLKKLMEYLHSLLQNILKKSEEIKQIYTRPKNFDICVCVFFQDQCEKLQEMFLCFPQRILNTKLLAQKFLRFSKCFLIFQYPTSSVQCQVLMQFLCKEARSCNKYHVPFHLWWMDLILKLLILSNF